MREEDVVEEKIDDNNLKINELVDRRGSKSRTGNSLFNLFNKVLENSLSPTKLSQKEVPMILLKHRWMKNRNLVAGTTTVSFNNEGIAKVKDEGNARLDVQQLLKRFSGLLEVVKVEEASTTPPTPAKTPVKAPAASAMPEKLEPKTKEEEAIPEVSEEFDESEEEADDLDESGDSDIKKQPKRKVPLKRKK